MKQLVIAEKPSVAKDLARTLGVPRAGEIYENDQYVISNAIGHLLEPCKPDRQNAAWGGNWTLAQLPMFPNGLRVEPVPATKGQLSLLGRLFARTDIEFVVCATDAGREGELIFRLIYNHFGSQLPIKRFWANSMTDAAIKTAWANLKDGDDYRPLAAAAFARAEADWLVGYNLTRLITVICSNTLFSLGRVQTPVLAMFVRRAREIRDFRPIPFWQIRATFAFDGGEPFQGLWHEGPEFINTHIDDEDRASAIRLQAARGPVQLVDVTRSKKKVLPDLPYDLTALQRDSDNRFGYSAIKTLEIAQALYEKHKAITYPRTDSRYLTKDLLDQMEKHAAAIHPHYLDLAEKVIERINNKEIKPPRCVDDSMVTDHHAIIPTENMITLSALSEEERNVYNLVCRRFLAAFLGPQVYFSTVLTLNAGGHTFKAFGQQLLVPGWLAAEPWRDEKKAALPWLQEEDDLQIGKVDAEKHKTTPPAHYTNASILAAMQYAGKDVDDEELAYHMRDKGLGTSATRAQILETLLKRQYIEQNGRRLIATAKGEHLISILEENQMAAPELMMLLEPELTGEWEKALNNMANSAQDPGNEFRQFTSRIKEQILAIISGLKQAGVSYEANRFRIVVGKCPHCDGQVLEQKSFYACEHHKKNEGCPFFISKKFMKATISAAAVKALCAGEKTRNLSLTSQKGKEFKAKLFWDSGKKRVEMDFGNSSLGQCPVCFQGNIRENRVGFGCDKFKDGCKSFFLKKHSQGGIDADGVKELLSQGETSAQYTFNGKNGEFKAAIRLEDGLPKFVFLNKR